MDGTLVDSTAVVEQEWRSWADSVGLDHESVLRMAHGRRTDEVIRTTAPHLDIETEMPKFLKIAAAVDQTGIRAIAGALNVVSSFSPGTWAVVTSAPRNIALRRLRLSGFPEPPVLISADDVKKGKPDPEGFLSAASRLGIGPNDCLAFEDAPAGITAALAANMRVIGLTTTHMTLGVGELHSIQTFNDIRVIVTNTGYEALVDRSTLIVPA